MRKQSAAEVAGCGGVAASEPSYMEGADSNDDNDAIGVAAAAA